MPRQPRDRYSLPLHSPLHADVIEQDGTPAHQDPGGRQVHEPVEDGHGVVVQCQERKEHKHGEQRDADVRRPPGRGAQEYFGRLPFQREPVEDAGAGQKALIAAAPSAGDDDGVDEARNGANPRGGGGDDEGALRGSAALVTEPGVVARDEHADDEHGEHVEQQDANEDLLTRAGYGTAGVLGFGGGHGDRLDARKGEDGGSHDTPKAEELAPISRGDVFDERPWGLPVAEADPWCTRDPA